VGPEARSTSAVTLPSADIPQNVPFHGAYRSAPPCPLPEGEGKAAPPLAVQPPGCRCAGVKALHLPAAVAAGFALLVPAPASAGAQQAPPVALFSPPPPARHGGMRGFHRFHGGFFIVPETEIVHDVVVVHDQPAEEAAPPAPPPPRKPYVIGRSYSSLPGTCMKMVDRGATYFHCSGEWYRQVRGGSGALYKAVARPL
jgi:hypothetical protein